MKFDILQKISLLVFYLQDDDDGHLVVLTIIEELMNKTQDEFLDHFARLGVFSKVQALIDTENENETIKSANATITATDELQPQSTSSTSGAAASGQPTTNGKYIDNINNGLT